MKKLHDFEARHIIQAISTAKVNIAQGNPISAQAWLDHALETLLRVVIQDVQAETIPALAPIPAPIPAPVREAA